MMTNDLINDELEALERNGIISPSVVVEWASKRPGSAIYAALEWDNKKAGHEYRVWQVRRLIAVRVVHVGGDRKFISLTIDRIEPGGGYRRLDDVLAVKDLRDVMLRDALEELQRFEQKYARLKELAALFTEAARVKKRYEEAQSIGKAPTRSIPVSRRKPAREERPGA